MRSIKTLTNYMKGKDIKCPFDCLWHYYTRKFNAFYFNRPLGIENIENTVFYGIKSKKPEDFDNW